MSQAALWAEKAIGHGDNATTAQDITNPAFDRQGLGDMSETMKALAWMGKNKVEIIEVPKPKIIEDRDVILKVTGSTVCGSDLHLLHGMRWSGRMGEMEELRDVSERRLTLEFYRHDHRAAEGRHLRSRILRCHRLNGPRCQGSEQRRPGRCVLPNCLRRRS